MSKQLQQQDIFSVFGIEDEYAERKKREEEERKKRQAEIAKKMANSKKENAANSKSSAKKDEFQVDPNTKIYFYTEEIDINDYFTLEELENGIQGTKDGKPILRKINESHLKRRLRRDYPVIAGGSDVVYMKKQNSISIILQARKKGSTKSEESDKGSFAFKRIPFSILKDFIAISKYYSDQHGTEFHADIYLDVEADEFFMDIPQQLAHAYWVEVTESPRETVERLFHRRHIKCMEIHSHHTMSPTPSLQDDESERAPLLYAIVGRLDKFFPDLTVRTFNIETGEHRELKPWEIFEYPFNDVSNIYKNFTEKVAVRE